MVGVNTILESLLVENPSVVTLAAKTAADVLPLRDNTGLNYVVRWIQNTTGADLYVGLNFTVTIDGSNVLSNYHAIVKDGLFLQIPSNARVSAMSVGGGKVVTFEARRYQGISA